MNPPTFITEGGFNWSSRGFHYTLSDFEITQTPLTVVLREKFEATTGLDCSAFFRAGNFVQGEAIHMMEKFLASPKANDFKPGARYFFAHPVA
ncbi:hypothetical protein [Myxococcus eversor]|uniref:hypothetical protein n=1 Tax=Myxococcus eversor TaxID=2709661 RepID=UPI0013D44A95|nr:hypothetical protein [Myxococcus eversor]